MADSAGLIESFGFRAEYIPPAYCSESSPDDWDPWFEAEIGDLIETYDAEAVVFDGSDPRGAASCRRPARPLPPRLGEARHVGAGL